MQRPLSGSALAVLEAVADGHRHGFDIMDVTGLPSGTVYPTLGRLAKSGLVTSAWEQPTVARRAKRPPRRYYSVTRDGARQLAATRAYVEALKQSPSALHPGRAQ